MLFLSPKWLCVILLALLCPLALAEDKAKLTVKGELEKPVSDNIRALVNIEQLACQPVAARYPLIRNRIRRQTNRALQAMGYYQSTLSLTLAADDDCLHAQLQVTPGPPMLLQNVDIRLNGDAAQDPAFQGLIDDSQLQPGERLRHERYSQLKKNLQQALINRGYQEGSLAKHRLAVDTHTNTATVELHVDSGPRYNFGAIDVAGSDLNESLVRQYLQFSPGTPFNNGKLLKTQQAMLGTSYFDAVRLQRGEPDNDARTIPIKVALNDRKRWTLLAGVGASTDTGPRVRLGVANRRVNAAGHHFRAETEVSQVQRGAGASYTIPLKDPLRERLDLHTSYVKEDTDSNDSERLSVGADYVVELESQWVATTSLEYLKETYQVADQVNNAELIIPGFQLSRIKADDPIYPRFGWRLNGKVRFADQLLSSTASFVQATTGAKLIFPLFSGRVLSRLQLGYTEVRDVTELPASLRFFAGGDSSVRGFAYQSLGPEDSDGDVIGGRHQATTSLEYDHPITENWHWAVFSDAGNAFNDFDDYNMYRSAGLGIRWRSPLGPIRLDLARDLEASRSWRIHLSMGPDL